MHAFRSDVSLCLLRCARMLGCVHAVCMRLRFYISWFRHCLPDSSLLSCLPILFETGIILRLVLIHCVNETILFECLDSLSINVQLTSFDLDEYSQH